MNPESITPNNLITKKPVKKQTIGRRYITVHFRILEDGKEKKALFKLNCDMKVYERDGVYSIRITVDEDNQKKIEHLQSVIREKIPTEEIKKTFIPN